MDAKKLENLLTLIDTDLFSIPDEKESREVIFQSLVDQCYPGLMNLKIQQIEKEKSFAEIPFRKENTGLHGLLHGGAFFTAGDTISALMAILFMDSHHKNLVTSGAKIKYIRPVKDVPIHIETLLISHEGEKLFFQSDFYNPDKKLVARAWYDYVLLREKITGN